MENWRQDGIHLVLGFTLAIVFLGTVVAIAGLIFLLLTVIAPASLRQVIQPFTQMIQAGLLAIAVFDAIAWNVLPMVGFIQPRLARRLAVVTAGIALFMTVSLLFSL